MSRLPRFSSRALTGLAAMCVAASTAAAQPQPAPLAGVWSLNKTLSEMPKEIGFNVDWMPPPDRSGQDGSSGGGRGRRASGGGGRSAAPFTQARESSDDFRRMQLVTTEARTPPARLMIVDTPGAVTITNELGQSRVLHPTGTDEWSEIGGVSIRVATRRDKDQLIVLYRVETNRDVRYTYSTDGQQLVVNVEFLDRGAGDKARFVYQPGVVTETAPAPPALPAAPASRPPGGGAAPSPEKFDASPGAELRGLKALGILVEDLGSQAVGCGLNHDAIETAVSARLTASGFSVRRNSDEDTYVYVNIMTTSLSNGTCVSRYDAYLYTHATANLTYRDVPVLVQVSLMHRGGIATTAPMAHAQTVTQGLENYIQVFTGQIRDANK